MLADDTGVGYLLNDRFARVDDFLESLHRVAAGGTALDPDVVRQLLPARGHPLARLTEREREVLAMMAQGYGNSEIADRLVVTERAVHKHIGNILVKFDLSLRTAATGACSQFSRTLASPSAKIEVATYAGTAGNGWGCYGVSVTRSPRRA